MTSDCVPAACLKVGKMFGHEQLKSTLSVPVVW